MSNRSIRIILLLVLLGVVALLVYNKVRKDKELAQASKMVMGGAHGLMVDAYLVKGVPLQNSIDASGSLMSNESIQVQPEVSGLVTEIHFKEDSHVQKGAVLVKIYDKDLKAQLEKLQIQLKLAEKTLARQRQLLAVNGISQQDVDNTANQVASDQADIDYYKAQIEKTEIRAPFSGYVGLRNISVGAMVQPGTVITTLYQLDPLKLEFSVPEKYKDQLSVGDRVQFSVAQQGSKLFSGKVYAIDPGIDPMTRTSSMRAMVANPGGVLSPGAFANVHIDLKTIPDAVMIPTQALIPTTRDNQVILYKGGKATFVNVQTGIRTKDKVQITDGVQVGDTVVIDGIMQARPGIPLKIMSLKQN